MSLLFRLFAAALIVLGATEGADAKAVDIPICEDGVGPCTEAANLGRIGLISGGGRGTYIKVADDIRKIVEADSKSDGNPKLRVVPMVGRGSLQNLNDLLFFEGTDVGLVQSDTLAMIKQLNEFSEGKRRFADLISRIRYLAPMYNEEIHVVCRRGACGRAFEDVTENIVVNLGPRGSGTAMTARLIATELGFDVNKFRDLGYQDALDAIKNTEGEPDAERVDVMFYVAGKPSGFLQKIQSSEGLELVEMRVAPQGLEGVYAPSFFDQDDGYGGLLGWRKSMRTLAVPAILAVYGGRYARSERSRNLEAFCQALVRQRAALNERAARGLAYTKLKDWDPSVSLGDLWERHPAMEQALRMAK